MSKEVAELIRVREEIAKVNEQLTKLRNSVDKLIERISFTPDHLPPIGSGE